jgi:hypothetical protein
MFAPKPNVSAAAAVASSDDASRVAVRVVSRPSSLAAAVPVVVAAPPPLEAIAVGPSSAGFFVPLSAAAAPLPPFDFGAMAAVQRQIGRISPLDPAELVASSESSASAAVDGNESADAVALSEHEALGLRIEATRAQCEECFGAALFERVYRALRDASDAQNRTVDDLQVR